MSSNISTWLEMSAVTAVPPHGDIQMTAVTAFLKSKQLLLFVFTRRSVCQYSMAEENPAAQRQTTVTAYLKSKQLLLFVFARRSECQYSMAEENPAAQRQTAVTAYFTSKQLLLFAFMILLNNI